MARVALISMPWAPITEPSLGLGIVSALLTAAKIENRVFHFNLNLLKHIKYTTYSSLAGLFGINDSMFLSDLNGEFTTKQIDVLRQSVLAQHSEWRDSRGTTEITSTLLDIRSKVGSLFIDECLQELEAYSPTIAGFTCMFDQLGGSLALAKKFKTRNIAPKVILGGYAASGSASESLRQLDFIDYVFEGEAEERFISFVEALENDDDETAISLGKARRVSNLDVVPAPNYDDYFHHIEKLSCNSNIRINCEFIPLDSSRGCWWGQKNHCIFCGIRKSEMSYTSKPVELFCEQVNQLSANYGINSIRISDYILPRSFISEGSAKILSATGCQFATEMKSNIKSVDAEILRKSGFISIQIGVESFSDSTLKEISKGVSALNNINSIRLLSEQGIDVFYNIIYGFDSDSDDDLFSLSNSIWKINHLPPPVSFVKLAYTADAPICRELLSRGKLEYHPNYDLLFPKEAAWARPIDILNIAYYFQLKLNPTSDSAAIMKLRSSIGEWHRAFRRGAKLTMQLHSSGATIRDTRKDDLTYELSLNEVEVINQIGQRVQGYASIVTSSEVGRVVDSLEDRGLLYILNGNIAFLARSI